MIPLKSAGDVPGEINTQNKNKGKINNCGFDPMRTDGRSQSLAETGTLLGAKGIATRGSWPY